MLKSTMVYGDGEAPLDGWSGQTLNLVWIALWKRIALSNLTCSACSVLGFPSDFESAFLMQGIF